MMNNNMNFLVNINFWLSTPFETFFDGDECTIAFDSFESFNAYLENPQKIETNEYSWQLKAENSFNEHLDEIAKELKKAKVVITSLEDAKQLTDTMLPQNKILVDLSDSPVFDTIKLLESLPDFDNVTFIDKYNSLEPVTRLQLLKTYKTMERIVAPIKERNFSPAEIAFLAFDIARANIYNKNGKEFEESDPSISRDLNKILTSSKIVCKGYSNFFACICEMLDVKSEIIHWRNTKDLTSGHASCVVYINDDKYNIHSLLAFDPTWASKSDKTDTEYVNDYKMAFLPLKAEKKIKSKFGFSIDSQGLLARLYNRLESLKELIGTDIFDIIVNNSALLVLKAINEINKLLGNDLLELDLSLYEDFEEIIDLASDFERDDNGIELETFKTLVANVRAYEFEMYPEIYPNDDATFDKIITSSFSYQYDLKEKEFKETLRRILKRME